MHWRKGITYPPRQATEAASGASTVSLNPPEGCHGRRATPSLAADTPVLSSEGFSFDVREWVAFAFLALFFGSVVAFLVLFVKALRFFA